jgi:O-antigen/teichoic acid export membrane protein
LYERSRHLLLFTLLGLLLFNFDLIFLRYVKGASDAGYYAAAYTLISFAANLIVAYAHTVLPVLARLEHEPAERNRLFQSAMSQAFAAALPLAVGGHLVAPQLIGEVFGGGFGSSVVALQWLIWSIPLAALREIPVVGLIAAHREQDLLRVNAITAACNIALCIVVIPVYGLAGAAAATVATELIRLALALGYARRAGLTPAAPERFLRPMLASAAMAAALLFLPRMRFELAVPIGGIAYAAGLVLTGGVELRRGMLPRLRV